MTNYRSMLLARADDARLVLELDHEHRHDARTWWRNREHLHLHAERLLRHLAGHLFPDPR